MCINLHCGQSLMMITVIIASLEYIIISNYALVDSKQA